MMQMSVNRDLTEVKFTLGLNPASQEIYLPDTVKRVTFERQKKDIALTNGRIVSNCIGLFAETSSIEEITIDYGIVKPVNANDTIRGSKLTTLKAIHFYVDTSAVIGWDRFLYYTDANKLHNVVIDGTPIDFSGMTQWNNTLSFDGLKEIRFVPDKIAVSSVSIGNAYTEEYSDETWASLVNALKSGQSGTFTIGSTAQTKIASILGDNASGLFVLSDTGTMTLADFATTIKGWTLA